MLWSVLVVMTVTSVLAAVPAAAAWDRPTVLPDGRVLDPGLMSQVLASLDRVSDAVAGRAPATAASAAAEEVVAAPGTEVVDGPGFVPPPKHVDSTSTPAPTDPKATRVRELVELRTESSEVWENSDGTRTLVAADHKKFFQQADGSFAPIDNTIVADDAQPGSFRNRAGSWSVSFAPITADGAGGVVVAKGHAPVRIVPEFAQQVPAAGIVPEVGVGDKSNVVTYRNVAPGIDVEYVVAGEGVKENVIITSKTAAAHAADFAFSIEGEDMTVAADGGLEPSGDNKGAWRVTPAVITDRVGNPKSSSKTKAAVHSEHKPPTKRKGAKATDQPVAQSRVVVSLDPAWLASLSDADFPVLVDPTITDSGGDHQAFDQYGGTPGFDAFTYENFAGNHYQGFDEFWHSYRVYPQYSAAFGGTVTNAHLDLTEVWGNTNTNTVQVHKANSTNPALWSYTAFNPTVEASTTFSTTGSIDVTALFAGWVAASNANQPVVFTGDQWPGQYTKKAFSATLSLTYSGNAAPPAATTNPQPPNNAIVLGDTPTLSVDPVVDPNPGDTVQYRIVIADNAEFTTPTVTSAWQSSPSYTVGAGVLSVSKNYWWRVETQDNHGAATIPSTGFILRRSALGYDGFSGHYKGLNTLAGNYNFSETDARVATVGPALAVTRTFNTFDANVGVFGKGWSTPYFMSWAFVGSNIEITYPDGRREAHTPNGSGAWIPPAGYTGYLTGSPTSSLVLHMGDNSLYTFAGGPTATTGRLTQIQDSFGHTLSIDYSLFPKIVLTDVASTRTIAVYAATGGTPASFKIDHTETPNPAGGVFTWNYTYDTDSHLTKVCDPRGTVGFCRTYTWEPGATGRLLKVIDAKGQTDLEVGYGTTGRITSLKDGSGVASTFTYTQDTAAPWAIHNSVTDPRTKVWTHSYNADGQLTSEAAPGLIGPGFADAVTSYTYDPTTKLRTGVTDANGHTATLTYNSYNLVQTETNYGGETTFYVYDDAHNKIKTCDARTADADHDGLPDTDTYCTISDYGLTNAERAKGLLRSTHKPGLPAETYTYTVGTETAFGGTGTVPAGLKRTATDVLGKVTTYEYYANGDLARVSDNTGPATAPVTVRYEAESAVSNYNLWDGIDPASTTPSPSGGQFRRDGNWAGSSILWTVSVSAAGTYPMTVRSFSGYGGAANRQMSINGAPSTTVTFPATAWAVWADTTINVTLAAGSNTIEFTYDGSTGIQDAFFDYIDITTPGQSTGLDKQYTYDALGRVITEKAVSDTFPAGVITTFGYDAVLNRTSVIGPAITNTISGVAHQYKVVNTYDANNNLTDIDESDLAASGADTPRHTHNTFNAQDLTIQTDPPAGGSVMRQYDAIGNVTAERDAAGRWTRINYSARNLAVSVDALGVVANPVGAAPVLTLGQTEYDNTGRPTATIDARLQRTENTYNNAGRLVLVVQKAFRDDLPAGATRDVVLRDVTFDPAGNATTTKEGGPPGGPALRTTTATYDAANRLLTATVAGTGVTTTITYNAAGQPTVKDVARTGVPTGGLAATQTRSVYDLAGRVIAETTENASSDLTTTTSYDTRGVMTAKTSPRGNAAGATPADFTTTYIADQLGRTYKTIAPAVSAESNGAAPTVVHPSVVIGFDTYGNVTHKQDERGNVTVTAFDKLNRSTLITYPTYTPPDGSASLTPTESFAYDNAGNLTSHTSRRAQTTTYTYDIYNHVLTQTDPVVTGPAGVTTYTYDNAGNPTSVTDPTGAVTQYSYDSRNQLRTKTDVVRAATVTPAAGQPGPTAPVTITGGSFTTTYDHDDLRRTIKTTSPEGVVTSATLDPLGEATAVLDTNSVAIKTTTYDAAGHPVTVTDPLGRQSRTTYDAAGRATTTGRYTNTGTLVTQQSATYDADGNVIAAVNGNGYTSTYNYDALGRVASVIKPVDATRNITTAYGYDEAGNRTRTRDGRAYNPAPIFNDDYTGTKRLSRVPWNFGGGLV